MMSKCGMRRDGLVDFGNSVWCELSVKTPKQKNISFGLAQVQLTNMEDYGMEKTQRTMEKQWTHIEDYGETTGKRRGLWRNNLRGLWRNNGQS